MKKIVLITALLLGMATSRAQTTITDVIKTIPQELLPYIGDEQRKEINEFAGQEDTIEIKNELNGTTRILTANGDFAQLDLNGTTRMQIKLLPVNDTTKIICMAKTVTKPVPDSDIKFYSTDWTPIHSSFNLPVDYKAENLLSVFTQRPDTMTTERYEELLKYIEPVIVSADLSKDNCTITFNIDIPFVQKDEINMIKAIIRQKTFKWDGNNFKIC